MLAIARSVSGDPLRSIGVGLDRLFLNGLLPGRAASASTAERVTAITLAGEGMLCRFPVLPAAVSC
jgi:hypothetical protein